MPPGSPFVGLCIIDPSLWVTSVLHQLLYNYVRAEGSKDESDIESITNLFSGIQHLLAN